MLSSSQSAIALALDSAPVRFRWARIAGWQVSIVQRRRRQQPAERRHCSETIPFLYSEDDGPRLSVAGDNDCLAIRRRLYEA